MRNVTFEIYSVFGVVEVMRVLTSNLMVKVFRFQLQYSRGIDRTVPGKLGDYTSLGTVIILW